MYTSLLGKIKEYILNCRYEMLYTNIAFYIERGKWNLIFLVLPLKSTWTKWDKLQTDIIYLRIGIPCKI